MTAEPLKPEVYARVFDSLPEGKAVLEELIVRFGGNPYVRGGQEAERETNYRAGGNRVVSFIVARINQASGVTDPNAEE